MLGERDTRGMLGRRTLTMVRPALSRLPAAHRKTNTVGGVAVDAIIFLAPISAFDQVLAEDPSVNRLQDSLMLWQSVTMNKLLANVNIILFLNKCDLLKV